MFHSRLALPSALLLALVVFTLPAYADPSDAGTKRLIVGEVPAHTVGAYRPFTIPGEIEEVDGLVELREGRNITIWCPERVAQESPEKAAAAKRFVESKFVPIGSVTVGYVGNAAGAAIFRDLGVRFTTISPANLGGFDGVQVMALGPGTESLFRDAKRVSELKYWLGKKQLLILPGADLSLLPFTLTRKTEALPENADATTVPDLPLFAGTARDFGEFVSRAAGAKLPVMGNAPAWILATSPACFAHLKNKSGTMVLFNVAPADVPEAARPALTRVWCTMLANLNIESGRTDSATVDR